MSEEAIQDTGSQEVASEAVAADVAPVNFLDTLDEQYRNLPMFQHITDVNDMAKGYMHAQRHIGADKVAIPGKSATADEWIDVYRRLGAPTEATAYEFEGDVPLQENYLNSFREHALNAGLHPRQANQMMDFVRSTVNDMNESLQRSAEEASYAAEQELRQEFGQAFDQRLEMAQLAAKNLLPNTDIFDELTLSNGMQLGNHPDIIRMFANLAMQMGEDNIVGQTDELVMTPEQALSEAARLMSEGPYNDKNHPQRQYYIDEVNRLYNLAYS